MRKSAKSAYSAAPGCRAGISGAVAARYPERYGRAGSGAARSADWRACLRPRAAARRADPDPDCAYDRKARTVANRTAVGIAGDGDERRVRPACLRCKRRRQRRRAARAEHHPRLRRHLRPTRQRGTTPPFLSLLLCHAYLAASFLQRILRRTAEKIQARGGACRRAAISQDVRHRPRRSRRVCWAGRQDGRRTPQ